MSKKRMVVGILLVAMGLGTWLTGCQSVPPPAGYSCKTQSGWSNLTGITGNTSGFQSGTYTTVLDAASGTNTAPPTETVPSPYANNGTVTGTEQDGAFGGSAESYMLTESQTRYYSAEELSSLNAWQLKVARNEIYARHGVLFGAGAIQDHFNTRSWYHGTIAISLFDTSVFNAYEVANINTIQSVEAAKAQQ